MSLDVFAIFYVSQLSIMDCVKRVRIRSYSGPYFSRIFPHSDWIRKMRTRITPNTDSFYALVFSWRLFIWLFKVLEWNNHIKGLWLLNCDSIKAFIIKRHFSHDIKLVMRPNAFISYLPSNIWVKYTHQNEVRSQSKHKAVFLLYWI